MKFFMKLFCFSFADGYKKADKLVRNVRRLWQKMTFSLNGADTNCRLKWNPETLEHPGNILNSGVYIRLKRNSERF